MSECRKFEKKSLNECGWVKLVELVRTVRKYGGNRRHVEIPKDYYEYVSVGDKVIVIDKVTYDKLKSK